MSWSAAPETSSRQSEDTELDKTLSSCWRSRNPSTESLSMLKRLRVCSLPAEDTNSDQLEHINLSFTLWLHARKRPGYYNKLPKSCFLNNTIFVAAACYSLRNFDLFHQLNQQQSQTCYQYLFIFSDWKQRRNQRKLDDYLFPRFRNLQIGR